MERKFLEHCETWIVVIIFGVVSLMSLVSHRFFFWIHLELLIYICCIPKFRPSCKKRFRIVRREIYLCRVLQVDATNPVLAGRSVYLFIVRWIHFDGFYDSLAGRCLHLKIDGHLVHTYIVTTLDSPRKRDEDEPKKKRESSWRTYGMAVSDLESYAVRQRVKSRECAPDPSR